MKNIKNKLKNALIILGFLGIIGAGAHIVKQKNKEIISGENKLNVMGENYWHLAGKYTRLDSLKFADSVKLVVKYNSEILSLQKDYAFDD